MDITASYRTRAPPKEHEEAVRMLLESIANKRQENGRELNKTGRKISRKQEDLMNADRGSLKTNSSSSNSNESASCKGIDAGSKLTMSNVKSTSTNDDSVSTRTWSSSESKSTSVEEENFDSYKDPIPSRTIAVQCDLKVSSTKRAEGGFFDTSMQASSISSTKYGFYTFSQETLDERRKLQQEALYSTTAVGQEKLIQGQQNGFIQLEAPTSMSELSTSSSSSSSINRRHRRGNHLNKLSSVSAYKLNGSSRDLPETIKSIDYVHRLLSDTKQVAPSARINSLPRRPMTALSYVSSNRLREANRLEPDEQDDSSCDERSTIKNHLRPIKSHQRAYSQQALSTPTSQTSNFHQKPAKLTQRRGPASSQMNLSNQPAKIASSSCSNSDCENDFNDREKFDQFKVARSEEVLLTKRGQTMPAKTSSKEPFLTMKSTHKEQVHELTQNDLLNLNLNKTLTRPSSTMALNGLGKRNLALAEHPPRRSRRANVGHETNHQDDNQELYSKQGSRFQPDLCASELDYSDEQVELGTGFTEDRRSDARSRSMYSKEPLGSMSLSRRPIHHQQQRVFNHRRGRYETDELHASAGRSATLTRNGAANIQQAMSRKSYRSSPEGVIRRRGEQVVGDELERELESGVIRSTSMRQINSNRPNTNSRDYSPPKGHSMSQDSDSPSTRTWTNPSGSRSAKAKSSEQRYADSSWRGARTRSPTKHKPADLERDSKVDGLYNYNFCYQPDDSDSTSSSQLEHRQSFLSSQPLDYDSQHRLNESGLPEVNFEQARQHHRGPSSYIGLSSSSVAEQNAQARREANHFSAYTMGRPPKIAGRAMSQQSLTRPTMPSLLTGRRRRRAGGSNSGSDVGGSSMSLVSRLNGRYENAHTRTPVIMYIPQITPKPATSSTSLFNVDKASRSSLLGKSGALRKSMRSSTSRSKLGSLDKLKRSTGSRNGSDSESSSMLRTLVKPRSSRGASRRLAPNSSSRNYQLDYEEENEDGVGQLMTEMDSYKFKRRYSMPKDAKINWFAKLKQKVSSASGK